MARHSRRGTVAESDNGKPAGTGTALAVQDPPTATGIKKQITVKAATDLVMQLAASRLREAKTRERDKLTKVEQSVGGQCKRVDDSVVNQAKQLMTRLAMISKSRSQSNSGSHHYAGNSNAQLDKIVGKMGAIVGELEAFQLTNRAVGLFEQINDHDFTSRVYGNGDGNPLAYAGPKVRAEAKALLEQYEIVTEPKTVKKGRGKNATFEEVPGEPVDLEALNDDVADEDDVELVGECDNCGCTDDKACDGGCNWANPEHSLCTRCEAGLKGGDQ